MTQNSDTGYDTRKILDQMKEEYWRSLTEAEMEEAPDQTQLLTVILGDELFGMQAPQTKEILKVPDLVTVPRTPPSVLGIFNLRGVITSVIDIRSLLGLKTLSLTDDARVVIVEAGSLSTGVVVEEVREILFFPSEEIIPVAKMIATREYMIGQAELEDKVMVMLDMEKILSSPDFQA